MEEVRQALADILMELGFQKRHIENFEITTEQLGINSLNLLRISMYLNEKFGTSVKLRRRSKNSLQDICNQVIQEMSAKSNEETEDDRFKEFNIASYLLEECNLRKGREAKTAVYFHNQSYTYGMIYEKVNQTAHYLLERGVHRGERIGIHMYSSPEFIYLFLGAIKAGIIPVLINMKMTGEEVKKIIEIAELTLLFSDTRLESNLAELTAEEQKKVMMHIDEKIAHMPKEFKAVTTNKEDDAFIIFTSGSSGVPKGVVHKQGTVLVCEEISEKIISETVEKDLFYSASQLAYAYALGTSFFLPFIAGASVVLHDDDEANEVLDIIRTYSITRFFAVPSVFQYLTWLIPDGENPFESCRFCLASGEALPNKIAQIWKERFHVNIYQAYGMTETLFPVILSSEHENRDGSLGKPAKGCKVRILDDCNEELGCNAVGNIVIEADCVFKRYWGNKQLTQSVKKDKLFITGDKGYRDEEGFIWYIGRQKDVFKINGNWQSVIPIEEEILNHEMVLEAAAALEVCEEGESVITAYVVAKEVVDYEKLTEQIKEQFILNGKLSVIPKKWLYVSDIPKGVTGKINRANLHQAKVIYNYRSKEDER